MPFVPSLCSIPVCPHCGEKFLDEGKVYEWEGIKLSHVDPITALITFESHPDFKLPQYLTRFIACFVLAKGRRITKRYICGVLEDSTGREYSESYISVLINYSNHAFRKAGINWQVKGTYAGDLWMCRRDWSDYVPSTRHRYASRVSI